MKGHLRAVEVALRLGYTKQNVGQRCKRGTIPSVLLGRELWIPLSWVEGIERARRRVL